MKRTVLIVLDGFGERNDRDGNAIRLAKTPTFDALYQDYPHTVIATSGLSVGLPEGQMGNSEVGHMTMGSGRIIYQDLTRINKAISDGDFFSNAAFVRVIERVKASGGRLHLLGLTSPGGVHSSLDHAYALLDLCKRRGLDRVFWHAFLDGRDTPPKSAVGTLREIERRLGELGIGRIASLVGRYFAMDRDARWDRVAEAYRMLVDGAGRSAPSAAQAIASAYAAGETDEFVKPSIIVDERDRPLATIGDGDGVIFFNFRADRARELTRALNEAEFTGFARGRVPKLVDYVCMCVYAQEFELPAAFPPKPLKGILGEYLADRGLAQFRTAETEKYAHVTFFFNGGREAPFVGEERRLVPSPKEVATYDQKPSMSAEAVADGVVTAIEKETFTFILANFANPDMVGHTGVLEAAVEAIDVVDECVGRIVAAARKHDTALLITADHGNCEQMVDDQGQPHTSHTLNPVPLFVVDEEQRGAQLAPGGRLCDVAPTVLDLIGLDAPPEMEGRSLLR